MENVMSDTLKRISREVPAILSLDRVITSRKNDGFNLKIEKRVETYDLPQSTIDFLLDYGFKQVLMDSLARAESKEDAQKFFNERFDKLMNGTLGQRSNARAESIVKSDPVITVLAEMYKDRIQASALKAIKLATVPKSVDKENRKKYDKSVTEILLKMSENPVFRAKAEEEIERRKKMFEDTSDFDDLLVELDAV
jgi:hypothetical protein